MKSVRSDNTAPEGRSTLVPGEQQTPPAGGGAGQGNNDAHMLRRRILRAHGDGIGYVKLSERSGLSVPTWRAFGAGGSAKPFFMDVMDKTLERFGY